MNVDLVRELGGDIPLMTQTQLRFLDDVQLVLEQRIYEENDRYLAEEDERFAELLERISAIEENLRTIIGRLRSGRTARQNFLRVYPKWIKVRDDGTEKLKEIAQSINTDRKNCNISKLVGYSASFIGGTVTLASAIAIPLTFGLITPLTVAGASMTAAGCATAIGTSVTETVLLNSKVKRAQEIIKEDKKLFQEMNSWLDHAAKLEKALSEVLEIDIVKDLVESIKDFVDKGTRMLKDQSRLRYIQGALNGIMQFVPANIGQAIPIIAVATVISVLVTVFLLLLNTENRLLFDCASVTIRSITGVVSLADDVFDVARFMKLFTANPAMAKDLAKAVTRGAVAVFGMALDVAGIALTSIDVHKGSLSPQAIKITNAAEEMEEEANLLRVIYEDIS